MSGYESERKIIDPKKRLQKEQPSLLNELTTPSLRSEPSVYVLQAKNTMKYVSVVLRRQFLAVNSAKNVCNSSSIGHCTNTDERFQHSC